MGDGPDPRPELADLFGHAPRTDPVDTRFAWGAAVRASFSVLPPDKYLRLFLSYTAKSEIEANLPYHRQRAIARLRLAGVANRTRPDPRRYREYRQVYESIGLVYERNSAGVTTIHRTDLGGAVGRYLDLLTQREGEKPDAVAARARVLGAYAAHALSACQLRNPTSDTSRAFAPDVEVFPCSFIWRAMLELNDRISSDELNRAILSVRSERDLGFAIERIARFRADPHADADQVLGPETISGKGSNDRVISWVALASFGWLLIRQKTQRVNAYYTIDPAFRPILQSAAAAKHTHRDFGSDKPRYVEHISQAAGLPPDLR